MWWRNSVLHTTSEDKQRTNFPIHLRPLLSFSHCGYKSSDYYSAYRVYKHECGLPFLSPRTPSYRMLPGPCVLRRPQLHAAISGTDSVTKTDIE